MSPCVFPVPVMLAPCDGAGAAIIAPEDSPRGCGADPIIISSLLVACNCELLDGSGAALPKSGAQIMIPLGLII